MQSEISGTCFECDAWTWDLFELNRVLGVLLLLLL